MKTGEICCIARPRSEAEHKALLELYGAVMPFDDALLYFVPQPLAPVAKMKHMAQLLEERTKRFQIACLGPCP